MAERKSLLLRLNPDLWDEIRRLADADLRSVNAEIEVLLREAVRRRGSQASRPDGKEKAGPESIESPSD